VEKISQMAAATDTQFPHTPDPARSGLVIRLFGPLEVCRDGEALPHLRTRKGGWLLAMLALHAGREVDRDWLTALLWPEGVESKARASLRVSLADLRRALGAQANRLAAPTPRTLCLDLDRAAVDALAFDADVAAGDIPSLERAVALYRGPFLAACTHDWAFQERQPREQAFLGALETLAARAIASGDADAAERHLRRAVATDPLRESAHRDLMALLADTGRHAAAVQVYRDLRLLLHREINAEPDRETCALFGKIRSEASPGSSSAAALHRSRWTIDPGAAASPLREEMPDHNLPSRVTRFVGREQEMAQVKRLLLGRTVGCPPSAVGEEDVGSGPSAIGDDRPALTGSRVPPKRVMPMADGPRLLTITGAGGCGKSRLALETGWTLLDAMPNGVWLVELASLLDPALLPQTVAAALGSRERAGERLVVTLVSGLKPKRLLLILDNCEHLLAACTTLVDALLRGCPDLNGSPCAASPSLQAAGPWKRPKRSVRILDWVLAGRRLGTQSLEPRTRRAWHSRSRHQGSIHRQSKNHNPKSKMRRCSNCSRGWSTDHWW
jgi:DNA-binding SARP family transcriptional activator